MIRVDAWSEGLTAKQQALIVEYFSAGCRITPDVWKAAGYSSGTTPKNWIRTDTARLAIRQFCELQFDLKKDFVKSKAASIILVRAFFNPADIIDSKGLLLPEFQNDLKKLGDLAHCIDGIETTAGKMGLQIKVKLADKHEAIKMLADMFDFKGENDYDEDDEISEYQLTEKEIEQEIDKYVKKLGYKKVKQIEERKDK